MYKLRQISELKKLENNPRTIRDSDFKKLVQSINENKEYFEARPVILSDRTGELVIIAGNQRYEAAKHLKLKEIPTFLISGLAEEKEREIIIRDNVSNGAWDYDLLANEWSDIELENWGVDLPKDLGLGINDLSDVIRDVFKIEITCDSEENQEKIYNELIEKGYTCRVLTL